MTLRNHSSRIPAIPPLPRRAPVTRRASLLDPAEITDKQRLQIGASTFYGGHQRTVYQHAHFEFGLENVSRAIRLVSSCTRTRSTTPSSRASATCAWITRLPTCLPIRQIWVLPSARFMKARLTVLWGYYRELTTLLQGDARREFWQTFGTSARCCHTRSACKKVDRQAEKRAIEVARYVLPVAAATTMVRIRSPASCCIGCGGMAAASDTSDRGAGCDW